MKRLTWLFALSFVAGCSDRPHAPVNGDTDFTNTEPGGGNSRGGDQTPTAGGTSGGGGATDPSKNTPAAPGAPMGRTGTVEEADIYRVDGTRLFYFNTYRGFLTFDIT